MPTVSARAALIDDLPAIVVLLADDVLGQGRENIGPPLHSDYFDAFKAIEDDPNQVFVVFEAEGVIVGCLQLSFATLLQSICSLSHLLTVYEQPCYRASSTACAACSNVSVLLVLRAYM